MDYLAYEDLEGGRLSLLIDFCWAILASIEGSILEGGLLYLLDIWGKIWSKAIL